MTAKIDYTKVKNITKIIVIFVTLILLVGCTPSTVNNVQTQESVTIYFETNQGSVIDTISGIPGKNIPTVKEPTKNGYVFTGWITEDEKTYRLTRFPQESITLYANWETREVNDELYKIEFITNSDETIETIFLKAGQTIPLLPTLQYKDDGITTSRFLYWSHENRIFTNNKMPAEDIVLTSMWVSNEGAIYFNTNNGTTIDPIVAKENSKISAPQISLYKSGHLFIGWYHNGKPYIFDKIPTERITLEAMYLSTNVDVHSNRDIPKMYINLDNNTPISNVTKDYYVQSAITINNTTIENELQNVSAEFKGRGNGSWWASGPKRGYRIKFHEKQSLFGEDESRHWVLLAGANFYDPTMVKSKLAFDLGREVFTNIPYTTSTQYVELYINQEYRGLYLLTENVRVAKNRINIESEYGVEDTGYLIEYDSYANEGIEGIDYFMVDGYRYGFTVKSPDPSDFSTYGLSSTTFKRQIQYIKDYTTSTLKDGLLAATSNSAYNRFIEKADLDSFVDMYILHELFKNTDTGWSSFYMYKEPGGKLFAVAPWDFDAVAGNSRGDATSTGLYVSNTIRQHSDFTSSELYVALMQNGYFRNAVKVRWEEISNQLKAHISNYLNTEFLNQNADAFGYNFYYWSQNKYKSGEYTTGGETYTSYSSLQLAENGWKLKTTELRSWLINRIEWLDDEWS